MKKRIRYINDDLLIRYLADETTESERAAVEGWLAGNERNKYKLAAYRAIFEESGSLRPRGFQDADKAWERFKQKVDWQAEPQTPAYPFKKWLAVAASIILLLSIGTWLYLRKPTAINFYATDKPVVDSLTDGSLISLASHSSLKFQPGNVREATLKGEAFFEVKHDSIHPFRIRVSDLTINVLGTSFNVKSTGSLTEIKVLTGIVGVSGDNQSVKLQAGERLLAAPGKQWQTQAQANFNINDYPGLLQAILKDPRKSSGLLARYTKKPGTSAAAKNKIIVRTIIQQLISERIVADGNVQAFRLDGKGFIINGVLQPDAVFHRYKAKYLPSNNFTIALGNEPIKGKGIFVRRDTF